MALGWGSGVRNIILIGILKLPFFFFKLIDISITKWYLKSCFCIIYIHMSLKQTKQRDLKESEV